MSAARKINSLLDRILLKLLSVRGWDLEFVHPGHYYSALPSPLQVRKRADQIWCPLKDEVPGIDLRRDEQLELLREFKDFYAEQPWTPTRSADTRYYFENEFFCHADGLFLYCMMRRFNPERIIEVGSGFSTAAILDVNERFCKNRVEVTCIEPHPARLNSLLRPDDRQRITVVASDLQDVGLEQFQSLQSGDFLFIDSTHVLKVGSDVHYLLSEVLPRLRPGVFVHFHDIFYPFQYPREWVLERRYCWNEAYALQAFLQFNSAFEVVIFNTYLEHFFQDWFRREMPLCLANTGGSIWIRRVSREQSDSESAPARGRGGS